MFPEEQTLIARGKHATLSKVRYEQIKRAQDICKTIQHEVNPVLQDCQEKPPANISHLQNIVKCLENLKDARERIITASLGMIELEDEAWPK